LSAAVLPGFYEGRRESGDTELVNLGRRYGRETSPAGEGRTEQGHGGHSLANRRHQRLCGAPEAQDFRALLAGGFAWGAFCPVMRPLFRELPQNQLCWEMEDNPDVLAAPCWPLFSGRGWSVCQGGPGGVTPVPAAGLTACGM